MDHDFYRIKRLPPYVFAEVNALRHAARVSGKDVIDLGMGNPDLPTPAHIVEKLREASGDPKTHRYSQSRGIPGLRKAQAAYYERRFGVSLNPDSEVLVTLGSKEGLANLAQAITAPGDVILCPNPSYPIHSFGFMIAGASVRHIPIHPLEEFLAEIDRAARYSVPSPRAVVVNFPSNPTAETVELGFYEELVALAKRHQLFVLSDLAYAEIYFDGVPAPSILEVDGAMEVAVEFTSMSKTYSMAGWRIGFAAGNHHLIEALARVKSYLDYGAFTPIQVAATAALNGAARMHRTPPRHLQITPRCAGIGLSGRRLGNPRAKGNHVRVGTVTRSIPQYGLAGVLQETTPPSRRGRCTRRGLRRARRRLRTHWSSGERATYPASGAQHPAVFVRELR